MGKDHSKLLKCVALCTVTMACSNSSPSTSTIRPAATTRPDVILLTIDTLRADHVGHLGGDPEATPALDRLARSGVTFLDATSHAPLTLPAHTSIMTARYPPHHGVHDNAVFALDDATPTLASLLKAAGYATAAYVSSYVLRAGSGLARGFDVYDDRFEGMGQDHLTLASLERRGPAVARDAAAWLARAPHPYFLWVHFYDPHAPYDPPPAFAERFPGRPYDGEIATSDYGVAALLAAVPGDRRSGTLVMATADHGEGLGDHGESQHGILLYDSTLHVPLMMAGPGLPHDLRVARQVRHVDILPTILGLIGLASPPGLDGTSLLPLVDRLPGRMTDEAPLSYAETQFGLLHFGWAALASGRDGRWKYIEAPAPELYDLNADRSETANRFGPGGTAAGMARAVREIGAASRAATDRSADADVRERLRSLGYASGRVELGAAGGSDPKDEIGRYETYVRIFNDGMAQLETGQPKAAEATFRGLARTFPRAFEAHQYLARALAAQGAFDAAVREFELTLALSPNEPVVYFDSARALAGMKRFDAAFDRVDAGRRQDPRSFYGALVEGLVAKAAGDAARAQRAFNEAVTINPVLAAAHYELGLLAESRGDKPAAEAEYRKALEGDPLSRQVQRSLARVTRQGK